MGLAPHGMSAWTACSHLDLIIIPPESYLRIQASDARWIQVALQFEDEDKIYWNEFREFDGNGKLIKTELIPRHRILFEGGSHVS
jgi:hypothetical protein